MISSQQIMLAMRSEYYGSKGLVNNGSDASLSGQSSNSIHLPPSEPLQIEKPNPDMMIQPPPKCNTLLPHIPK